MRNAFPAAIVLILGGCAHRVPVATTSDPDRCVDDGTAEVTDVVPHGDLVTVCYGHDGACLVVDHVRGTMVEVSGLPLGDEATPPELDTTPLVEPFSVERTEHAVSVCRAGACRTFALPGVADVFTVMPTVSADGTRLSYTVYEGNHAFVDTIDVATTARTSRIPIVDADARNHGVSTDRVGTAVLVRDTISVELFDERTVSLLVQPATGAKRVLGTGTAYAIDDHTALVLDGHTAEIIDTTTFATLASEPIGAGANAGVNEGHAVLVTAHPLTIVAVDGHHFGRRWRLPVCR